MDWDPGRASDAESLFAESEYTFRTDNFCSKIGSSPETVRERRRNTSKGARDLGPAMLRLEHSSGHHPAAERIQAIGRGGAHGAKPRTN